MSAEPTLFTRLARAGLHLDALQVECLDPLELTFTEYSVLRVLGSGPLPPSRLADAVVRTTGGMTKLVDRLSRRGLVERVPDPDDGRGVLVRLTAEGREVSAKASSSYSVGRNRVLRRLGAEDRRSIDAALARLVAVFEDDRRDT